MGKEKQDYQRDVKETESRKEIFCKSARLQDLWQDKHIRKLEQCKKSESQKVAEILLDYVWGKNHRFFP